MKILVLSLLAFTFSLFIGSVALAQTTTPTSTPTATPTTTVPSGAPATGFGGNVN